MVITFGAHNGDLVERVLIEDPGYVRWMLQKDSPDGPLATAVNHVRRCIAVLNAKPFAKTCVAKNCGATATRGSMYERSPNISFWCPTCSPYSLGAAPGKLQIVQTYNQVMEHVALYDGTKHGFQHAADGFVAAKGLAKPRTEKKLLAFFATT